MKRQLLLLLILSIVLPGFAREFEYFDPSALALYLVRLIGDKKVGDLEIGATASEKLLPHGESTYTDDLTQEIGRLSRIREGYWLDVYGTFSEKVARHTYSPSFYMGSDWNPSSKLRFIELRLRHCKSWGRKGHDAFCNALKVAGFNMVRDGETSNGTFATVFNKDGTRVIAYSNESDGKLMVYDTKDMEASYALLDITPYGMADHEDEGCFGGGDN